MPEQAMAFDEALSTLIVPAEGEALGSSEDALALIGEAFGHGAAWVALPSSRLRPDFFQLRNRMAGEFLQKFATYKVNIAIVGDIAEQLAGSEALRAFVVESNRGDAVWFLPDLAELGRRLA